MERDGAFGEGEKRLAESPLFLQRALELGT